MCAIFGVYLSDLTFVYHGNPDYLYNRTRQVNFAKRAKTSEIVSGIDRFKTTGYNFQEVLKFRSFLMHGLKSVQRSMNNTRYR